MPMNPRLLRPRATGFDPRRIANLTGWYDAADSASYTESSGQITEWRDKSGQTNHLTQTTANNRPTLFESSSNVQNATQSVINGVQSLFFDATNDKLSTSNTVTSGQSRTVFAVARRTNNTPIAALACLGSITAANTPKWLCRYGNSSTPAVGGDTTATNQTLSGGVLAGWTSGHVSCWSQNSGTRNLSYFLDGTSYSISGNPPTAQTSFAGLTVGSLVPISGGDIQFYNGHIGELVIYDRELSEAERTSVTRYLGRKWGVTVT